MTGPGIDVPIEILIDFRREGGELTVELLCGEVQMGTYSLRLWAPDRETLVRQARGTFTSPEQDRFPLLAPALDNDGHLLQCRARVWLVPGSRRYAVFMTVKQDGVTIGEVAEQDESDEATLVVELRARLRAV